MEVSGEGRKQGGRTTAFLMNVSAQEVDTSHRAAKAAGSKSAIGQKNRRESSVETI